MQHLGHLQTGRMTSYRPSRGRHWLILSFCLSGWYVSLHYFRPCACYLYLWGSLTYTILLSLCLTFQQERCNVLKTSFSIVSFFIAFTLFSLSCPVFIVAGLLATVGPSLHPPDVLGAPYLLLFFLSTCTPSNLSLVFACLQFFCQFFLTISKVRLD